MLDAIHIQGLRGITKGSLTELSPLTILVGPNRSGKSTVLDAMLIGTHTSKSDGIGQAVQRRQGMDGGARWLISRSAAPTGALIWAVGDLQSVCTVVRSSGPSAFQQWRGTSDPGVTPNVLGTPPITVSFDIGNEYQRHDAGPSLPVLSKGTELLDSFAPYDGPRVTRLYTELLERNEYAAAETLLNEVSTPGASPLRIDTGADHTGRAILMVRTPTGAVPLAMAGDGVKMFARLAMTLALSNTSLLLLEEPEAHLHPRTLLALAGRIRDAVRRGLQVVLTTHSLELVDQLIRLWQGDDAPKADMCAFRLALRDGELLSTRFGRNELADARFHDGDDVR